MCAMKKITMMLAIPFLLLAGVSAAAAQDVRYNFDKDANFASFRSFKWVAIKGATHYYVGQPALLNQTVELSLDWLAKRGFGEFS